MWEENEVVERRIGSVSSFRSCEILGWMSGNIDLEFRRVIQSEGSQQYR
jgi:hypothetical protein